MRRARKLWCRMFGHRMDYVTRYATGITYETCSRCGEGTASVHIVPDLTKWNRPTK